MCAKITKSPFGTLLKELRKRRELTAEELATKAGEIDRTYISKIENHGLLPSYEVAKRICDVLKNDKLMELYMSIKHPKATKHLIASTYESSLLQNILHLISEGKTNEEIIEYFTSFNKTQAKNSKIAGQLDNLINKLRDTLKDSDSITLNLASAIPLNTSPIQLEDESLPYFLANPKKISK